MPTPEATPQPILLCLAGPPLVRSPGAAPHRLAPRDALLLAWLAIEGPTPREQMAALLWPDSERQQGLTALRQRLFTLRRAAGVDLAEGSPLLQLAPQVRHDLDGAPTLLGALVVDDAQALDDWLQAQRAQRRQACLESLHAQADEAERQGDWPAALDLAHQALALDAVSERAHRRLIRGLYLQGDRPAAVAAFDACAQALHDELGVAPDAQTQALLALVQAGAPLEAAVPPRAAALPASLLRPPLLRGREAQHAALARALKLGQVAVLLGEAGMGKSRLLAEWRERAPQPEGLVIASARPGDARVPFAFAARLLEALCPRGLPATLEATQREPLQLLAAHGGVAGLPAAVAPLVLSLVRPLLALLRALAAQQPLHGLLLDDLHAADDASLELLQALLLDPLRPGSCVLAWRPGEAGAALRGLHDALAGGARLAPIELPPLDQPAVAALVDDCGLPLSGADTAPALLQLTGGNPLFLLETLKQHWLDASARPGAEADASLPHAGSVLRLIERRVERLPPEVLALARVAALAVPDFSLPLAGAVMSRSPIELADALAELERAQILKGERFAHDLVHEAVRRGVPAAVAATVQAQIAEWLQAHGGVPARVGGHWLAAGRHAEAAQALRAAAQASRVLNRVHEAADFLMQAAQAEVRAGRRAEGFRTLVLATHMDMLQFLDARWDVLIDQAAHLADGPLEHAIVDWMRGNRLSYDWQLVEARPLLERAAEVMHREGDAFWQMEADGDLAITLAFLNDFAAAWPLFERVQSMLAADAALAPPVSFFANHATALDFAGRVADAHDRHQAAVAALAPGPQRALILSNLALNRMGAGDPAAAAAAARESLRQYELADAPAASAHSALLALARAERRCGRWAEALELLDQLGPPEALTPVRRANRCIALAECYADLGRSALAQRALDEADAEAGAVANRRQIAAVAFERVRLARWAGRDARGIVERLGERLGEGAFVDLRLRARIELARSLPPAEAAWQLGLAVDEAQALGQRGLAWIGRVALIDAWCPTDPVRAAAAAAELMAAGSAVAGGGLYLPEVWRSAQAACRAAGDALAAERVAAHARAWIRERVAQGDVPAAFVEGFLHRHPVHEGFGVISA